MNSKKLLRIGITAILVLSLLLMVTAGAGGPGTRAEEFDKGDIVEVYDTGTYGLNVREEPCGVVIGGKFDGDVGMILDGPVYCDEYNRYHTRWSDEDLEGWSAEDWLRKKAFVPSTKFNIGDHVEVCNTGAIGLYVRTDPPELAKKEDGGVFDGYRGVILDGPFYGVPKGRTGLFHFWKVEYGSVTGWCAEGYPGGVDYLKLVINQAPNVPSNPSPANHATGQSIQTDLGWTGGDPDTGDTVTYDVYFGTSTSPPKVSTAQSGTTYDPGTLKYNKEYYWKIVATDNHVSSTTGPLWDFTTGSTPNTPPYTPSNPSPATHATGQSIQTDLGWTGGDPDTGDTVTYDVYFGTSTSPPKVSTAQSGTTYDPGTLKYNKEYYWKIVATDNHVSSTTGPLWDFTTGSTPNNPPYTPSNPSPATHATGQSIQTDLGWTGGDPDTGDTVTYDVYFGTSTSPPKVSTAQSGTTYDPGTLKYNKEYYWKIVATDNHVASTTGPLWDFTTGSTLTCAIELRKDGAKIDEIDVGESFDIYVGDSTDDTAINEVRFSSDDSQDGILTGEWTVWYEWDTSSGDWDAETKIKEWSFDTGGAKEVWADVKDEAGQTSKCSANIYANPLIPQSYAIIVAGQGRWWAWEEKWVFDHCANNAYRVLRNLGFDDDHIFYLNSRSPHDIDGDGDDEVDELSLLNNFTNVVFEIKDKMGDTPTPFILYLVGHGQWDPDYCFIFDVDAGDQGYLWDSKLQEELDQFPSETPMLIVIGSCYSGGFITSNEGISAENRIIITAATAEDPERNPFAWARSSDRFWGNLNKGLNVKDAFITDAWLEWWDLWLDDNGDRGGSPPNDLGEDGNLAAITQIGVPGTENLKLTPWIFVWKRSPGELRVYDSQNQVTGLVNGEVKEEIPDSIYDEQDEIVALFSPSDTYRYEVAGTDEGTYGLDIVSTEEGDATTFTATNVTTSTNATHQYTIDWEALSQGEEGVTIQIDSDGDGTFEETIITNNTFHPPVASFSYLPQNPIINQVVTFNASPSYPDSNITNYAWNFDDGNTSETTETIITHTYASAGDYTVNLTVTDDDEATDTTTEMITVNLPVPPTITVYAPPSHVSDTVCTWRTFNVTVNQQVNVSWYLNGTPLYTNESVQEASCTLHAEVMGEHNVSATARNANGTDMQTWIWYVGSPTNCTCGDICVNTTGWWRHGGAFNPCDTPIQDAIDSASAGDTICVKNGIYHENVDVYKSLTLLSENGAASTIVDALYLNDPVFTVSTDYANVSGFTVKGAMGGVGFYIIDSNYCTISDSIVSDYKSSVRLESSSGCTLSGISASVIELRDSSGCTLSSINASGIELRDSSGCTLSSINASGIELRDSSGCTLSSINASGIELMDSSDCTLSSINASGIGIYLYTSSNCILSGITTSGSEYGIYLAASSNCILSGINASGNEYGIYLAEEEYFLSSNCILSGINASDNRRVGVALSSNGHTLTGSIASYNGWAGISSWGDGCSLSNSIASYNGQGGISSMGEDCSLSNNIASYNGAVGISSMGEDCSLSNNTANTNKYGIHLAASSNCILSGINASGNEYGIYLAEEEYSLSSDCTLSGINASGNKRVGIALSSNGHTLTGSIASYNGQGGISSWGDGCSLSSSIASYNGAVGISSMGDGCSLTNNIASYNGEMGIYLGGSDCSLANTTANTNKYGIYLDFSDLNLISNNNCSFNNLDGIHLSGESNNNTIYNNYFSNTNNAYDCGNNIWNITKTAGTNIIGGSRLGGNYWSNYRGDDLDGDGLGDTLLPYNASGNIFTGGDWHPLLQSGLAEPKITSFAPSSPVIDTVCNWSTFDVMVNQRVNVSWYLNGTFLFTNETVREASCVLHAVVVGEHDVTAIARNENGTDMQTWIWAVRPETQTIILNNVSHSFPMFSNAEYVDFTIGDDTITLSLDTNASFDGVCNLTNLTGTNISASGSSAKLKSEPIASQAGEYDQKWVSAPYFDAAENKLYLLSGSGLIDLELHMGEADINRTRFVGVGDLTGTFNIETEARRSEYSNTNYLDSSITGVGYTDLYAKYAPDTAFENISFIPTFSQCEQLHGYIETYSYGSESSVWYRTEIEGVANGAEPIFDDSYSDYHLSLDLDAEYAPTTCLNASYDHKWELSPYFDAAENKLYLLSGSGLIDLHLDVYDDVINKRRFVGVGDLTGTFNIDTEARRSEYSNSNYLVSSITGVGYTDLYAQYAPDTSFENITFIPTFSQCEQLHGYIETYSYGSESSVWYRTEIEGVANGSEPIFDDSYSYYGLSLNLDAEYAPTTCQNASYDHKWELSPYFDAAENKLYLLSGSGLIDLELDIYEDAINKRRFVGLGDLTGTFNIDTEARRSEYSNSNYLDSSITGVGYTDLYAQYAPDTAFENITFIPTFSQCEQLHGYIETYSYGSDSSVRYRTEIEGVANGAEPISDDSYSYYGLSLNLDAEYAPTTCQNASYDQKWELSPFFDAAENKLYLLSGSGLIDLDLYIYEHGIISRRFVGVGDLTGTFNIETEAKRNEYSNYLVSSITGVGYTDLYAKYAPDTSFENITFIPTFSQCEQLQLIAQTSGSLVEYWAYITGLADGVDSLKFDNIALDNVAINATFALMYHPVDLSGDVFDEKWTVKPVQSDNTLVILRGTGTMTALDFVFDDGNATHPEISSYGFLFGDYNVAATILPHYMSVNANGADVLAMDKSGRGGFGITFGFTPVLSIEKEDDPDPVLAGGVLNYSITVNNFGYANATDVTVTEKYDENVTFVSAVPAPSEGNDTWVFNTLKDNATKWINISVAVNLHTPNGAILHNIVNVTCDEGVTASDTEATTVFAVLVTPEITSFAPPSPVNDTGGATRTFNITINQTANVSWYLNGTIQQTTESVTEASCTLHANVSGEHNVTAIASNANGTAMQTWIWNVAAESSYTFVLFTGWNMISFPVEPLDIVADSIFGPDHYDLCTWDPDTRGYVPVDAVGTEIGYGLLVLEDRNVTVLGTPLSEYNTNLTQGWNMIGSIREQTNVPNGTETVPADQTYPQLFTWCRDHYELTQDIDPGVGYWALAYVDCELHVFPAPSAASLPVQQITWGDNDWRVRLALTSGAGTDVAEFGLHEDATDNFNAELDVPEPPSPPPSSASPYLQAYFYDPEDPVVKKLSTSYIPHHFVDDEECNSWLFSVDYNGDASDVIISWNAEDINVVPAEYSFLFIAGSEQIDMRTTPSYTFHANTETYEFEIRAITIEKKPDLVIDERYEKEKAGRYTVFFVVKNAGTATAPGGHYATLYVDGVERDKKLVSTDLEPGETYKGSFKTKVEFTTGKVENIKVCADSYNDVDELDEANNCLKGRGQPVENPPTMKPPLVKRRIKKPS